MHTYWIHPMYRISESPPLDFDTLLLYYLFYHFLSTHWKFAFSSYITEWISWSIILLIASLRRPYLLILRYIFLSETDKRFAILDIWNSFSKRFASVGFGISNFGALPWQLTLANLRQQYLIHSVRSITMSGLLFTPSIWNSAIDSLPTLSGVIIFFVKFWIHCL